MLDKKSFKKEIEKIPLGIALAPAETIIALIEIRESIDRYIDQRIESDKVLEGVLKDIHCGIEALEK